MSVERKQLILALTPPAAVALLRFGGGALLALFDMGWRCGPRNTMDVVLVILLVVAMHRCTKVLERLADARPSKATACWRWQCLSCHAPRLCIPYFSAGTTG